MASWDYTLEKFNSSPVKNDGWKLEDKFAFPFGAKGLISAGYVELPGGIPCKWSYNPTYK